MAKSFPYIQIGSILLLWLVGFLSEGLAIVENNECESKLIGLVACLPFVQGSSGTPSTDCCVVLKQVITYGEKCICGVIKDRKDLNLGIELNTNLVLKLPGACSSQFNATACIDLYNLNPNSTDAQVFKQFESTLEQSRSTTTAGNVAKGFPSNPKSGVTGTIVVNNGGAGEGRRWLVRENVLGVWIWCLIWIVVMGT